MRYKISVIIPAYNMENYIEKAINSITNQELEDLEIIVINDGSKDNTVNVVNNVIRNNSSIKIINIENHGVSYARNIGIKKAQGEYLLFLDADDWIDNNSLLSLYNFASENNLDLVNFGYKNVKDYNQVITNYHNVVKKIICNKQALKMLFLDEIKPSVCNKLIKTNILNKCQFIEDIYVGEDLVFTTNVLIKCKKIGLYNSKIYNYYHRNNSITNKVDERIRTIKKALILVKECIINNDMEKELRKEFQFLEFKHLYFYRVIVGKMPNYHHRFFYNEYVEKKKNIKANPYYIDFYKESSLTVKARINFYEKNYNISRIIHSIINYIL